PVHYGRKTVHHRVRAAMREGKMMAAPWRRIDCEPQGPVLIANGPLTRQGALPTMLPRNRFIAAAALLCASAGTAPAALAATLGQPHPWQLGFQESVSPVMDRIIHFHDFLLYIITAIVCFVLVLLVVCMVRFNAQRTPVPSRTTHNTFLEVAWT